MFLIEPPIYITGTRVTSGRLYPHNAHQLFNCVPFGYGSVSRLLVSRGEGVVFAEQGRERPLGGRKRGLLLQCSSGRMWHILRHSAPRAPRDVGVGLAVFR